MARGFCAGASVLGDDRARRLRSPNAETESGPDRDAAAGRVLAVKLIRDPSLDGHWTEIVPDQSAGGDGLLLAAVNDSADNCRARNTAAGDIGCCLVDHISDRADFPFADSIKRGPVQIEFLPAEISVSGGRAAQGTASSLRLGVDEISHVRGHDPVFVEI